MDVERLKRLNALAGELKGHHIAENYEDAACLAVAMVSEEPEQCFTGMHLSEAQSVLAQEIVKEYPQETQMSLHDVQESAQESYPPQASLSREEVEKVLQYFADQFTNEINALQQKMLHAEAMVAEVTAELRAVKEQAQRERTQSYESMQSIQQSVQKASPQKAEPLSEKQEYVLEDVSVEKMFYFGKK